MMRERRFVESIAKNFRRVESDEAVVRRGRGRSKVSCYQCSVSGLIFCIAVTIGGGAMEGQRGSYLTPHDLKLPNTLETSLNEGLKPRKQQEILLKGLLQLSN